MKRVFWFVGFVAVICFSATVALHAQEALNNEGVVGLKQAGLGDTVIINKIKASKCDFDISADGLKQLKEDGLSDDLINVIIMATETSSITATSEVVAATISGKEVPKATGRRLISASGATSNQGYGFAIPGSPFDAYDQHIRDTVQKRWWALIFQAGINSTGGVVTVDFQIFNDGHLEIAKVLDGTGIQALSLLCKKAILESGPFGPLPKDLRTLIGKGPRDASIAFYY